ncbi:MaoC family dehydratase [Pseudonocardia sp. DLS-67]
MGDGLAVLFEKQGQELGVGEWVEITQERVDRFADATEDHQWIHVDPERAEDGPYHGTIAHGFLTLSLVLWLGRGLGPRPDGVKLTVNYGLNRVRFPAPVPVGSRVRARVQNLSVEQVSENTVQVVNQFTVEVEGGAKPACVAEVIARHTL